MAMHKPVRRNYGDNEYQICRQVSNIKIFIFLFKEGVFLLCQSILETSRISHFHGSAPFTIPLKFPNSTYWLFFGLSSSNSMPSGGCSGLHGVNPN